MASAKHSPKARNLNARKLRASSRAKEYYSEFAENVRENYIPRFLYIEDLIYGTDSKPEQGRARRPA